MKVLLCQDVKRVGWVGDIVEVNAGYARNFLLPQGLAKPATEANIKAIAEEKARRSEVRKHERGHLEEVAAVVEGAEAVVAAKANEQGVLFGSVGAAEIAANLREQGFEVADEYVDLPENIKQVGTHTVALEFAEGLAATVSVVVVPEGGDIAAIEQAEGEDIASPEKTEQEENKKQAEGE